MRSLVDLAKTNIKQFYEMYDRKIKSQITHPLFQNIDDDIRNNSKLQILTE